MKRIMILMSMLFVMCSILPAQIANEGGVLGVVADRSGAMIPGAAVTAKNLETGFTKEAKTDSTGAFEILGLPIGPYTVTVSMQGFKTWTETNMVLAVGQRARVSPLLEVGELSEHVSVQADSEQLQTENASVDTVVQQKQIRDLPLN